MCDGSAAIAKLFSPPVQTQVTSAISHKKPVIPHKPLEQWYEHTQIGTDQIWVFAFYVIFLLVLVPFEGWIIMVLIIIPIIQTALRGTLTVTVSDDALSIRFGPLPWYKKTWSIREITSVSVVKFPFNHFFGMGLFFGGEISIPQEWMALRSGC